MTNIILVLTFLTGLFIRIRMNVHLLSHYIKHKECTMKETVLYSSVIFRSTSILLSVHTWQPSCAALLLFSSHFQRLICFSSDFWLASVSWCLVYVAASWFGVRLASPVYGVVIKKNTNGILKRHWYVKAICSSESNIWVDKASTVQFLFSSQGKRHPLLKTETFKVYLLNLLESLSRLLTKRAKMLHCSSKVNTPLLWTACVNSHVDLLHLSRGLIHHFQSGHAAAQCFAIYPFCIITKIETLCAEAEKTNQKKP